MEKNLLDKTLNYNYKAIYPKQLKFKDLNPYYIQEVLNTIFERDIKCDTFKFRDKAIKPLLIFQTSTENYNRLKEHLTTKDIDSENSDNKEDLFLRKFDPERSKRLHWIRYHIDENKKDKMLIFSYRDREGNRTYIYDISAKYVIVLEPSRDKDEKIYYFTTAYFCSYPGKVRAIENKYKNKLDEIL